MRAKKKQYMDHLDHVLGQVSRSREGQGRSRRVSLLDVVNIIIGVVGIIAVLLWWQGGW